MKRILPMLLVLCLLLVPATIHTALASSCSHTDDWGYPLYGETLKTWKEYPYYTLPDMCYVVEYEHYVCSACNEEALWFSDWYDDHMFGENDACTHCGYTADGEYVGLPAVPTPELHPEQLVNGDLIYVPTDEGAAAIIGYTGRARQLDIPAELAEYRITAIGDKVFENQYQLESVTIPEGITAIGDGAFLFCNHLTDVALPSTLTSIGQEAFLHCISLDSITLPEGIATVAPNAFDSGCQIQ